MSQKLMSAQFYREPSERDDLADLEKTMRRTNRRLVAKSILMLVIGATFLGGGGFVVCRAAWMANQPKSYSGTGASPGMDLLSFFMNLVDFGWDKRVDDQIRQNPSPFDEDYPYPVEVPENPVPSPDFEFRTSPQP